MEPPARALATSLLLALLLQLAVCSKSPESPEEGSMKCVSGYCLPANYQKLELPMADAATTVQVETDIMDVLQINDKEFSVTLTMYFAVRWMEPRMITNNTVTEGEWTPIDMQFLNHLWVPNIYIYDLKSFNALSVLKKLAGVWIVGGKEVYYNEATSITFLCPMRFDLYPLDSHICKFRVGSTNLDMTRMMFPETTVSYDASTRNTILDYAIGITKLREADRILPYGDLGNYSITGFEMTLNRHSLKYMYVVYLPSGLFVVVSWASFLVQPEIVPGRMAMLITLFLVLINIFNSVTSNSPNVEGMTAIAAWLLVCIMFVFGAMGGYAYLLWRIKKSCLKRKRVSKLTEEETKARTARKQEYRSRVDDFFLVVFPLMFLLFNLIYWPMCLRDSERHRMEVGD